MPYFSIFAYKLRIENIAYNEEKGINKKEKMMSVFSIMAAAVTVVVIYGFMLVAGATVTVMLWRLQGCQERAL